MKEYRQAPADEIAPHLIGRRIVSINRETFTLTLDDESEVRFMESSECCAWFEPTSIDLIDQDDNIIVKVEEIEPVDHEPWEDGYDILILSASGTVAKIGVEGSEGSGYYVHHVGLRVSSPRYP